MIEVTLYHIPKREVLSKLRSSYRRQLLNFATLSEDQYGQIGEIRAIEQGEHTVVQFNPAGIPNATVQKISYCLTATLIGFGQYTPEAAIAVGDIASGRYMASSLSYNLMGEDQRPYAHVLVGMSDLAYNVMRQKFGQFSNCCPTGLQVTITAGESGNVNVGMYGITHTGTEDADAVCSRAFNELNDKLPSVLAHLVESGKPISLMPVL